MSSMARAVAIGSSASSAVLGRSILSAALGACERLQASVPAPREMAAKGRMGMPGTRAMTPAAAETMPRPTGLEASWVTRALSAEPSTPDLETRKPAAMEMIRAGIWLTRPSPMVITV